MNALTPSLEDYLEAIWVIGLEEKVVRVKDIVQFLTVRAASVVGAAKILEKKKLIVHEKYGYIDLTDAGIMEAKKIYGKHKTLSRFFNQILGVDIGTATEDACRFEHQISKETMDRIVQFIEFIETCPEGDPSWLSSFHHFAEHGTRPEHCERKEGRQNAR